MRKADRDKGNKSNAKAFQIRDLGGRDHRGMTVIQIGCSQKGLANWVQQIVTGGIIVAAVALDRIRSRA